MAAKHLYWCLHCERTYEAPERDHLKSWHECPTCGASAFMDGWDWSHIRLIHPEYPERPLPDVIYPMY